MTPHIASHNTPAMPGAGRVALIIAILLLVAAQFAPGASPALARQTSPGLDAAELARFLDAEMAAQLEDGHTAGGVVVVVQDGELSYQQGYGYADVEAESLVDPAMTLFRIGSVSKLFTATAVMQLVEQGRLDLDADINTYLDFEIPDTFDEPLTLAHLLTHTAGFEHRWIGMWPDSPEGVEPLGAWLAANLPERVRPPGHVTAYSNYGAALAGYIVERASGLTYAEYIEQHILSPLGMTRSSAHQPLPAALQPHLSRGYAFVDGELQARDFEWLNLAPAGVISNSGADMARFMLAHLNDGVYDGARILDTDTARLMHAQHFSNSPGLNGVTYGFYEMSRGNLRVIGHGGDTNYFHSVLALFPEQRLGLFVAFNSADAGEAAEDVRDAFIDHFFPTASAPRTPVTGNNLDKLAGSYRVTSTAHSSVEKLTNLFGAYQINVDDTALVVRAPAGDEMLPARETRYLAVEPVAPGELLFQEEHGPGLLAFREDQDGATYAFIGAAPVFSLEKLEWYETPVFHQLALGGLALILISGLAAGLLARRHARRDGNAPRLARAAGVLLAALGTLTLLLLLGLGIILVQMQRLIAGDTALLGVILALPLLVVAASVAAAAMALPIWRRRCWPLAGRIHITLIALAGLTLTWFLAYWNLLGWQY